MVANPRRAAQSRQTTLRHLWLAGLGLVAVAHREAIALPERLLAGVADWQRGAANRLPGARKRPGQRRGA